MENLFKLNTNENFTENDAKYAEILHEPWCHLNSKNKGLDLRKCYIQAFNYWLKLDETEVELVMDFFQWIHTGSILLDDVLDSSEQRRGDPAAYVLYGVGRTISAIDFCTANYYLTGKSNPYTEKFFIGRDKISYWRDNYICPSEDEYLHMLYKKTGYGFFAIGNFMQAFTKTNINVSKLWLLVGSYIQLSDDYRGLNSKLVFESKGFCDDIRDGKFTLPFIHAIKSRPNDKRLMGILKMRTNDIDLKKKCLELLEEFGSMEYTRNKISYFKNLIKQEIELLGLNDDNFKIVYELHNFDY